MMKSPLQRTAYDKALEALSFLGLVCTFIPLFFYGKIGEDVRIPIHYNAAGEIDGWGSRSAFWQLPMVAVLFYFGLTLCERFYKKFSYPVKVTPFNAEELYRLGVQLIRHLKFFILLMLAYLNNTSLSIALGYSRDLNGFVMSVLLVGLFSCLIIYVFRMIQWKD